MKHLPAILLLSISFQLHAQNVLHCGADEMRIATLQVNPKIATAVVERDLKLEEFTREFENSTNRGGQIMTIPVVFHVIHEYGNENISRAQILDGLSILNNTFRKTAADTADIIEAFKPIHADCEIQFALAAKDPEGNCHSGINRIASALTNVGDHQVKELIHWNPQRYLNVYIVSNAAGLAGHAVWPADADTIPEWDGIVIAHNYVGSIGTSNQTQSVVFAHECGHYLNLHHIWGGNNVPNFYYLPVGQQANCDEDDQVADTPNTIGWSSCNLSSSSCGNIVDNVQNAMDYSYCNVMFTEGQKMRMRAALNSPVAGRNNIWTTVNLIFTGVIPEPTLCAADFEADNTLICNLNGEAINFTNTSYHGGFDSLRWEFPAGDSPFSVMENPIVVYYQPGTFDVSLTIYSNGQPHQITKEDYITFLPDSSWSYPFWDWFEGSSNLNGNPWTEKSVDLNNKWELTDVASISPSHSIWVDNWDNNTITVDELYSPRLDLSSATQMRLAFKYAFAGTEESTNGNKLSVQVSRDCETNWSTRLNLSGNSLETAANQSSPFIPTADDWQQADINIPSSYLEEGFRFRFIFTSMGNNRLFVDDVNVDITAGINEEDENAIPVSLYPSPATSSVKVDYSLNDAAEIQISILDVLGKIVLYVKLEKQTVGSHSHEINLNGLSAGTYFIRLRSDKGSTLKRFVIN